MALFMQPHVDRLSHSFKQVALICFLGMLYPVSFGQALPHAA